jgi:hypothetical protein
MKGQPADVKGSMWPYNLLEQVGVESDDPLDHMSTEAELYLAMCLSSMDERETRVIRLRYFEQKTLKEVGEILGITSSRVREVEAKGIRKLRCMNASGDILRHGAKAYMNRRGNEKVDEVLKIRTRELEAEYMKKMAGAVIRDDEDRRAIEAKLKTTKISELDDLSLRSYNCLGRVHVHTVGELMERYPTYEQLITIRNLGRKSAEEIIERVQGLGFNWPAYE